MILPGGQLDFILGCLKPNLSRSNFHLIYRRFPKQARVPGRGRGGWGVLGLIFAGYVPLASQNACPVWLWPIVDPISVTFGQICNFRNPTLDTFYFY